MLEKMKNRLGIHGEIEVYDNEIMELIADAICDLKASGVPALVAESESEAVTTAIAYYVKANFGSDRSDTDTYMSLYRQKVFRLTLEEGEYVEQ